jgi:hypothetical protein
MLAGHTSAPVPCPVLGTCITHKAAGPDWSALGVLMMLLVLVLLLMILEYVRVAGRCGRQMKSQEDNVMQLIEAVGFKVSTLGRVWIQVVSASRCYMVWDAA